MDLRLGLAYLELLCSYFLLFYGRIVQPVRVCPRVRRMSDKLSMTRRIQADFKDSLLYACLMSSVEAFFEMLRIA